RLAGAAAHVVRPARAGRGAASARLAFRCVGEGARREGKARSVELCGVPPVGELDLRLDAHDDVPRTRAGWEADATRIEGPPERRGDAVPGGAVVAGAFDAHLERAALAHDEVERG